MNTSSIIILFSIRKIYYILRRKSSIFMSRFFYFGGCIIRGGGGVTGFFLSPDGASNSPSRKGGVLLRSAFSRGATKGWAGETPLEVSRPEKMYRRKRNKPLQSDDFPSLRLSVREKFLEWYQTHLEESFWTLQRKVRLLGLSQFHFLYKLEFHFQIPHFIFENRPGSWV